LISLLFSRRAGKQGWSFIDMLADFNLLLFLSNFLDIEHDMPNVCRAIMDRAVPLDEGYMLLIRSLAGMDM
jgi:nuclear protein localization protein 4 homolog